MIQRLSRLTPLLPGVLGVVTAGLFFRLLATPLYDPDLWWHLAAGREMVTRHVFLRQDIFSHTLLGARWVNFEWLSQILMFLLYKGGGFPALFYAKVFLGFTAVLGVVVCCRQRSARGPWLVLISWLAFGLLRPRLLERPELATLNFLPVFVFLLTSARSCPSAKLRRLSWILFALMVLWCNLHGGFVYGLGVTALFALGARWDKEPAEFVRFLDRTLGLLLIAGLVNPNGARLVTVFADHLIQLSHRGSVIQEWASPSVQDLPLFWALFLAGSAWLAVGLLQRKQGTRFWAPAVAAFACWGALSYRNAALFGFVALPFLSEIFAFEKNRKINFLGWLLCLVPLLLHAPVFRRPFPKDWVAWNRFPVNACRFVEEKNIQGVMYNSYDYGGYIDWRLGPDRKVFMDGRYIFHPLIWEQALMNESWLRDPNDPGWRNYLSKRGVNYAIVGRERFLGAMFPPSEWACVFEDDAALVLTKRP